VNLKPATALLLPAALLLAGCEAGENGGNLPPLVEPLTSHPLQVQEPSGLALDPGGEYLWTVSDETGTAYQISTSGQLLGQVAVGGEDLEGIALTPWDGTLLVADEATGSVRNVRRDGSLIESRELPEFAGDPDSGLEGITVDGATEHLHLAREAGPPEILELDRNYSLVGRRELEVTDISGLARDPWGRGLWVLEDEDKTISLLDANSLVLTAFRIQVFQPEGIAVDRERGLVYVVSDATERLYHFPLPEAP
jgi:uncharacterized protein YjiK